MVDWRVSVRVGSHSDGWRTVRKDVFDNDSCGNDPSFSDEYDVLIESGDVVRIVGCDFNGSRVPRYMYHLEKYGWVHYDVVPLDTLLRGLRSGSWRIH